ncbi:MAG TPA: glycoside hydrolase family 15 protein, partial [Rhizomicrobium sp.]|nr:glycoside hydrolase family 15 protein [Rhizomicrobium sp.]
MNLEAWITRQRSHAAAMMRQSISPSIVKTRPRFFQTIVPKPGSVVASPVPAAYDPEPDYFFHWYRDSAVVMDALRLVKDEIPGADALFDDFVRFSLDLAGLDGRAVPPP